MKYLIVNGDDFGASHGINRGMMEAHQLGILTATSLMVNMPATLAAVDLGASAPDLSIGLHVNFTNEGDDPVVDLEDTLECRRELGRQFDRFVDIMGRLPTHIDSQHNVHRLPHLWTGFVLFAEEVSLPLRGQSPARYFPEFYGQWDGETHLEQISVGNLKRLVVQHVGAGVTELSCHPGYVDPMFTTGYNAEREAELATLTHHSLRRFFDDLGIYLIGFDKLGEVLTVDLEDGRTDS